MSDAAMKVDPDFYNRSLLESDANGLELSRNAPPQRGGGAGSMGGSAPIGMMGGGGAGGYDGGYMAPDLPDYLVRQHSLLGLYLSLNPTDEADAERNWGFPQQQRAAIAAVTVVVPLFLALFLTGGWLWKVCMIGAATTAARLGVIFVLNRYPDVEVTVQGHTLAVWPHFIGGTLATVLLIWFVTAAASSTGWSTMWLCFTFLGFFACAEAALRGGMWHFQWWKPADHFSFLKPWEATAGGQQQQRNNPRASSYAPPRPVPTRSGNYTGSIGVGGGDGGGGGGDGGDGGAQVSGNNAGSEKTALLEKKKQSTLEDEIDDLFQESV